VRERVLVPAIGEHCEEWNFREKMWFLGWKEELNWGVTKDTIGDQKGKL